MNPQEHRNAAPLLSNRGKSIYCDLKLCVTRDLTFSASPSFAVSHPQHFILKCWESIKCVRAHEDGTVLRWPRVRASFRVGTLKRARDAHDVSPRKGSSSLHSQGFTPAGGSPLSITLAAAPHSRLLPQPRSQEERTRKTTRKRLRMRLRTEIRLN